MMNREEKLFSQSLELLRRTNEGQSFPTFEHELMRECAPYFAQGFFSPLPDQTLDIGPTTEQTPTELKQWATTLSSCQLCPREWLAPEAKVLHQMGKWEQRPLTGRNVLFLLDAPKNANADLTNLLGGEGGELLLKMVGAMKLPENSFSLSLLSRCFTADSLHLPQIQQKCRPHLEHELEYVRPRVVVAMGAQAVTALLGDSVRLAEAHGQFFEKKFSTNWSCQVVPIFHPEYLMVNPSMKKIAWEDLQKIMAYLRTR